MVITPLYAGILALWFLVLSVRVVQARVGPGRPSLGDGGDARVLRRIRGHANFAEYVPIIVAMMALLELGATPAWLLHGLGLMLVVGRILHGYALSFTPEWVFGRTAGIVLTFVCLLVGGALCVYRGIQGL